MSKKRGSFSGGLGFVFAAAGSAVGLGNLWRFPYYAAKYGGGTFSFVFLPIAISAVKSEKPNVSARIM